MNYNIRYLAELIRELENPSMQVKVATDRHFERNIEQYELFDKMCLLRRSYNADLVGLTPKPVYALNENFDDSYIYPFFLESKKSYVSRLQMSIDVPIVAKFLSSYVGAAVAAGYLIEVNFGSDELNKKFFENIDNNDTTFKVFLAELLSELLLQGRVWVVTDVKDGMPYSRIVPREFVFDWVYDNDLANGLIYFSYYDRRVKYAEGVRTYYDVIEIWEPNKTTLKFREVPPVHRRKRYKPMDWGELVIEHDFDRLLIRDAWFGAEAQSILYPVALMQVDYVNLLSEVRQQIRNQGVAILTGPQGFTQQLKAMSVNSAVELDNNDRPLQWVAYPSFTLQSHFQYLELLKTLMYEIAQSVNVDPLASGVSKQWDFLDTQNVLNTAADAIESLVMQIIDDWYYALGRQAVAKYSFTMLRDFNTFAVKQTIDNMIAALSVGLDSITELKIKQSIRDKLVKLTPEELKESNEELEMLVNDSKQFEKEDKRGIGDVER